MPFFMWLATGITGLASGMLAWFAETMAKRIVFLVAVASAFALMANELLGAATEQLSQFAASAFPAAITVIVGWVWPPVASQCISAIAAVEIAIFIYKWQVRLLDLKARF